MKPQHRTRTFTICLAAAFACFAILGCEQEKPYGTETRMSLPTRKRQVWAVAPAINLSGQADVDSLLQADDLYGQLQQIDGLTVIPVNRVAEIYAGLRIDNVKSPEQAALVCDLLGCDALVVPTVTMFDPYNPPKLGASLQLFRKPSAYSRPQDIDPRELSRAAAPPANQSLPAQSNFLQVVGMFDAANGSVRTSLLKYAAGRNDPKSPLGAREYLQNMDRYCGFVYSSLAADLLKEMARPAVTESSRVASAQATPASADAARRTSAAAVSPSAPRFSSSTTDFLK